MVQRDANYYDLIGRALGGMTYQSFVDSFNEIYNVPQTDGFAWDEIQMDFTYHQFEAEMTMYTMASYVDLDSDAPLRAMQGVKVSSGDIPRMKHGFAINEKIIREQMMLASKGAFDRAGEEAMMRLLFKSTDSLIGGNHNRLSRQRHQAVSTGKLILDDTNNPDGIKNLTLDFKIPSGNITTKALTARWWTDAAYTTEGAASDPLADMVDLIDDAQNGHAPSGHLEMSKVLWRRLKGHSKFLTALGYVYNPESATDAAALLYGKRMTNDDLLNTLVRKLGYPVVIVDHQGLVEKYNKDTKKVDPVTLDSFDPDSVVYVPDGEIGTIKAVQPLIVPDPAARIAYFDEGRTALIQTFDASKNIQYIKTELTALCVPNKVKYMFYLKIK